jgi:ribosomal protein S2
MGKLVNLNKFRKQKAKLEKEQKAQTNRRLHGRTKAERAQELLQKRKLETQVDGARLDAPDEPEE